MFSGFHAARDREPLASSAPPGTRKKNRRKEKKKKKQGSLPWKGLEGLTFWFDGEEPAGEEPAAGKAVQKGKSQGTERVGKWGPIIIESIRNIDDNGSNQ